MFKKYPHWSVNKYFCSRENNLSELTGNYITNATHKKTEYDLECLELYNEDNQFVQYADPKAKPLQEKFYSNGKYMMKIHIVDGTIIKEKQMEYEEYKETETREVKRIEQEIKSRMFNTIQLELF